MKNEFRGQIVYMGRCQLPETWKGIVSGSGKPLIAGDSVRVCGLVVGAEAGARLGGSGMGGESRGRLGE